MDQKLIDYIKDGFRKGYSEEHLKDVLIRFGHSLRSVSNAMDFIRYSTYSDMPVSTQVPERVKPGPKVHIRPEGKSKLPIIAGILVAAIILAVLGISVFVSQEDKITGLAVKVEEQNQVQESTLSQLEAQKAQVEEKIKLIDSLQISIDEKDKLIKEQLAKLDEINAKITKERQDTRDMLLEQTNAILKRNIEEKPIEIKG